MEGSGKVKIKRGNIFKCKKLISQRLTDAEPVYAPEEYAAYQKCLDMYYGEYAYMSCKPPTPLSWNYTNEADYALIQLNRRAWFRKPFKVRTEGEIALGTKLVVIGHPLGLPSKVTNNGEVWIIVICTPFPAIWTPLLMIVSEIVIG